MQGFGLCIKLLALPVYQPFVTKLRDAEKLLCQQSKASLIHFSNHRNPLFNIFFFYQNKPFCISKPLRVYMLFKTSYK